MIDTKALREKVLDLAIRGKLVPQDPTDEPASVLLERIREQKKQMVKEGKLKAKDIKDDSIIFVGDDNLHYEKFADGTVKFIEDEVPFDLPPGWSWCRLKSITEIITKGASPKWQGVDYTTTGTLFITSENVGNDTLTLEKTKFLNDKINEIQPRSILKKHDVLTNIVGASIGRTCEYTLDTLSNINQAVAIIRMVDICFSQYIVKCLNSKYCISLMLDNQVDMARANLSLSSLSDFLIPLPPVKEQNRIVKQLKSIFVYVEKINSSQKDINEIVGLTKSKILDLAIRGQLVPQDSADEPASVLLERIRTKKAELIKHGKIKRDKKESVIFKGEDNSYYRLTSDNKRNIIDIPFDIPDNWEWCNLSMIGSTNIGLTYKPADIVADGTMVLRSSNIINGKIDLSDLVRVNSTIRENQYIQENDILICARNGSKALVGKCAIFENVNEKASFGAFMAVYRSKFFRYVYYFLNSEFFRNTFSNDDSKQINQLTQDMIKNTAIPLPPFAEQNRIVETIEVAFAQLDEITNSIS